MENGEDGAQDDLFSFIIHDTEKMIIFHCHNVQYCCYIRFFVYLLVMDAVEGIENYEFQ